LADVDVLTTLEGWLDRFDPVLVWVMILGGTALLVAWNKAGNLKSAALLSAATASMIVIPGLMRHVLPDARAGWIGIAELVLLSVAAVLLGACSLIALWSLLARAPLRDHRPLTGLVIFGYAPVILLLAIWAIVFGVLAAIGF
jgi:hypothetical protein